MIKNFFLSPDPVEGAPVVTDPPAAPPGPSQEPPPAATVVVNGEVTEELVKTRKQLNESETARKKAETDAAHFADEARRLKEAGLAPSNVPIVDKRSALEKFMAGEEY